LTAVPTKDALLDANGPSWPDTWVSLGLTAIVVGLIALLMLSLIYDGPWWAAVLLVPLIAHLMHAHVLMIHEAVHFNLAPNRWLNEAYGTFIGTGSFVILSLYRAMHYAHHSYQASERDEEFWPFVDPAQPLWKRRFCAVLELMFGTLWTPGLFLRAFLRRGSLIREPAVRRRIWLELILMIATWTAVIGLVAFMGWWKCFLIGFALPSWIAGNLQAVRKFIEHLGLTASDPVGLTRSIVAPGPLGTLMSFTLLHEPYHGVHHKYGGLRHSTLPRFADVLPERDDEQRLLFNSYSQAAMDMVKSLRDPKIGGQWRSHDVAPQLQANFATTSATLR
jgi:fatty acid desaturase